MGRFQGGAKGEAGTEEARLDGAGLDAQHEGDLVVFKGTNIAEDQDRAMINRELGKGIGQAIAKLLMLDA